MINVKRAFVLECTHCSAQKIEEELPGDWTYSEHLEMCLCPDCSAKFRAAILPYVEDHLGIYTFAVMPLSYAFKEA